MTKDGLFFKGVSESKYVIIDDHDLFEEIPENIGGAGFYRLKEQEGYGSFGINARKESVDFLKGYFENYKKALENSETDATRKFVPYVRTSEFISREAGATQENSKGKGQIDNSHRDMNKYEKNELLVSCEKIGLVLVGFSRLL